MNFRVKIINNPSVLYTFCEINSFLPRNGKRIEKNFLYHKGSEAKRLYIFKFK